MEARGGRNADETRTDKMAAISERYEAHFLRVQNNKLNMLTHAHFSCDHVSKIRMRCILCGAIWSVRSP
jgi:hypothetical protein